MKDEEMGVESKSSTHHLHQSRLLLSSLEVPSRAEQSRAGKGGRRQMG